MSQEVIINPKPTIDFDDKIGYVSAGTSSTGTKISWRDTATTNFRTRTGRRARLTFIGNAVDPGGENHISFHILINGCLLSPPFDNFQQAMGETYNGWARMSVAIDLPQNALVEVAVDNDDGSSTYGVYFRVRVEYEAIN